jgi:hypothetical protein
MGMLRGGPGNSQSELPCITRPLWLRTVTHRPVGPIGLMLVAPAWDRSGDLQIGIFISDV